METNRLPTYAEERDRVCSDGSHWLAPTIREAFSRRCSEFHVPYSDEKRFYIDLLMRNVYKNIDPTEEETVQLAQILKKRLSSVAIAGNNPLAEWLRKILKIAGIPVVFSVNMCSEVELSPAALWPRLKRGIKHRIKYRFRRLLSSGEISLNVSDRHPKVDVVIITDYLAFDNYAASLKQNRNTIKSILELVD